MRDGDSDVCTHQSGAGWRVRNRRYTNPFIRRVLDESDREPHRIVIARYGLSINTLRAWRKRYGRRHARQAIYSVRMNAILAHLSENPGERCRAIAMAVGLDSVQCAGRLRYLLLTGRVRRAGPMRACRYYVRRTTTALERAA
jgi:hypothetical protein